MRKVAIIAFCLFLVSPLGIFAAAPASSASEAAAPESVVAVAPGPVSDQTWLYLDEHEGGIWGITACSLGNHPIKESARENLDFTLKSGIESGFPSAGELALSIIALVKLGENPRYYQKNDLLLPLFSHENIYADGLAGAYYALDAYQAIGSDDLPTTARNSPPTLVDYIVSSQQRSGGFAFMPGYEPDVRATANAISAIAPYSGLPHVATAIEKALVWLSAQQQNNAAMPADGKANCEATARTLMAIRQLGIAEDDPRFVKSEATLEDALGLFKNPDGGYSPITDTGSDVSVTETVVIALYTNEYGISPYLAPKNYPGYLPPPPPEPSSIFGRFIVGFVIVFGALYLVLILTTKIGKRWGYTPTLRKSGSPAPPSEDTKTLELHIPMKAELPDFSKISDKELFSGYQRSPDKKREPEKIPEENTPNTPDPNSEPHLPYIVFAPDDPEEETSPSVADITNVPDNSEEKNSSDVAATKDTPENPEEETSSVLADIADSPDSSDETSLDLADIEDTPENPVDESSSDLADISVAPDNSDEETSPDVAVIANAPDNLCEPNEPEITGEPGKPGEPSDLNNKDKNPPE